MTCSRSKRSKRSSGSRTTRVPSCMSTMPAVRGSVRPPSVSRGRWSSVLISERPVSTNTGRRGHGSALLAGRKDLVGRIRVKGFEFGMEARQMLYPAVVRTLEQYDPARVRALITTTKQIAGELGPLLGNRLRDTPTTVQIGADDILEIAMERGGLHEASVVPYEASAALSMLLLRDHGMLMVHFVGVPPGTADLLIKFVPPETLERFGGARRYARAIDDSLTR